MNYLETIAEMIFKEVQGERATFPMPSEDHPYLQGDYLLYMGYALVLQAKGRHTTNRDVHDAWVMATTMEFPEHRSLIPFEELPVDTQQLDDPYRRAIQRVAKRIDAARTMNTPLMKRKGADLYG
jgi:hypothetical protein